jgi:hypothetical protein
MRNPIYVGKIESPDYGVSTQGDFEQIVDEATFYRAQAVLDGRVVVSGPRQRNRPDFPLRGFLRYVRMGGDPVNCRQSRSIAVFAPTLAFTCAVSADQVPGRLRTAPLITQGPGSDIRATVRELRDSDQRAEGLRGVVFVEVMRDGPAQRAGLMPGEVITQVVFAPSSSWQCLRQVNDQSPRTLSSGCN